MSEEKCSWDKIHNKRFDKLHFARRYISKQKYRFLKNSINNLSSYTLTSENKYALSFSLEQHIFTKNTNKLCLY